MRLFFFGSLVDRDLLRLVLARDLATLTVRPASLPGWRRVRVLGESYPVIVPSADHVVDGITVESLRPDDLDRLLFFEGDEYALRPVDIVHDGAPARAHVFASTEILQATDRDWHLDDWRRAQKAETMYVTEEWMALHGRLSIEQAEELWDTVKARALARFAADQRRRRAG
ncbi:MAG: gamma-glutamylcyclotransferase family protein [Azospirillaceae bacterium]